MEHLFRKDVYYFLTTTTFKRRRILSTPEVAQIIFDAFQWLENEGRLRWICIMIMPDHIHAIIQLGCDQTLASVMYSLKSFTAREINALRGETGCRMDRRNIMIVGFEGKNR